MWLGCGGGDDGATADVGVDSAPDTAQADPAPGPDVDAVLVLRNGQVISGCLSPKLELALTAAEGNQHADLEAATLSVAERKDFPLDPLPLTGFLSLGGGILTCETTPFHGGDTIWVVELGPELELYSVYIAKGPNPAWYQLGTTSWKGSQQGTIQGADTATFDMVQVLDLQH